MDNIERYNQIGKSLNNLNKIKTFVPNPNETDYKKGYITRYFIRKSNDDNSQIYEISSKNYSKYSTNPLYSSVKLDWRISGPITETKDTLTGLMDRGVRTSNLISVKIASEKISNIKMYLPNFLQFHKS
jgi:hypothetical protein